MISNSFYLINKQVAMRVGGMFYVTRDGEYVTDARRLRNMRLRPGEVLGQMTGTTQISRNDALTLIARGGYKHEVIKCVVD
jgi:hypothetical protein